MLTKIFSISSLLSFVIFIDASTDLSTSLPTNDPIAQDIANLKTDDVILSLADKKVDTEKKRKALNFAVAEIEKRKIPANSLLKSPGDRWSLFKGFWQTLYGYGAVKAAIMCSLICKNEAFIKQISAHFLQSKGAELQAKGQNITEEIAAQANAEARSTLTMVGNVGTVICGMIGGLTLYLGLNNLNRAITRADAHEKLKRAQAIATHIRQVSAI